MHVSFTPILLLQMGSLSEVLEIKALGQRKAGEPHRRSLTFLPQAEEQVNSNRKKPDFLGKFWVGSVPRTAPPFAHGRGLPVSQRVAGMGGSALCALHNSG